MLGLWSFWKDDAIDLSTSYNQDSTRFGVILVWGDEIVLNLGIMYRLFEVDFFVEYLAQNIRMERFG